MIRQIQDFNDILVVGNGFDLNLGLKTSYSDYLRSDEFKTLLEDNRLANYLERRSKTSKWVDIEKELFEYSTHLFYMTGGKFKPNPGNKKLIECLKDDYHGICFSLKKYLKRAMKYQINPENKAAYDIISKVFSNSGNTYILTFNYTEIIENLQLFYFHSKDNYFINNIHVCLSDDNIVFGIEDSVEVAKEHVFLYKSHNINQNINGLISVFENAKNITFFGYSLGETDHSYFDDFFKAQTMPDCKDKNFTFYYYGDNAYDDLIWQLKKLTNNRLSYLKQYNKLNFIDVK